MVHESWVFGLFYGAMRKRACYKSNSRGNLFPPTMLSMTSELEQESGCYVQRVVTR